MTCGVHKFQSRWGGYEVTRVKMACPPEVLQGCGGTITQRIVTLEANDISEAMSIVSGTLFLAPDGGCRFVSYDGQSRTVLKPQGREIFKRLIREGFSLTERRIDEA